MLLESVLKVTSTDPTIPTIPAICIDQSRACARSHVWDEWGQPYKRQCLVAEQETHILKSDIILLAWTISVNTSKTIKEQK